MPLSITEILNYKHFKPVCPMKHIEFLYEKQTNEALNSGSVARF